MHVSARLPTSLFCSDPHKQKIYVEETTSQWIKWSSPGTLTLKSSTGMCPAPISGHNFEFRRPTNFKLFFSFRSIPHLHFLKKVWHFQGRFSPIFDKFWLPTHTQISNTLFPRSWVKYNKKEAKQTYKQTKQNGTGKKKPSRLPYLNLGCTCPTKCVWTCWKPPGGLVAENIQKKGVIEYIAFKKFTSTSCISDM